MKRLFNAALAATFGLLVVVAYGGATPNCWGWLFYEPAVPKALRK